MNREILFRGKCEGKWHYSMTISEAAVTNGKLTHYYFSACPTCAIPAETVGQYTGLKDKNGKKIFEGDIFKFDDEIWQSFHTACGTEYDSCNLENFGVVGFNEDLARYDFVAYKFNNNSVEADLHENHEFEFADFICDLEVIGNIHDNPELMDK